MFLFFSRHENIIAVLLTALVIICGFLISALTYIDTDGFMRAQRIFDWLNNFSWFETKSMHSNYPFGEVLHWTRPMDILWLLIAFPFMLFMDTKEAIFNSGFMLSPLMEVISFLILLWGLRPYLSLKLRFVALFLLMLQLPVIHIYIFSRPDHHSVLALLTIATVACGLRYLAFRNKRTMAAAGFFAAMSVWIAIEGLFLAYSFLGFLLLLWLVKGEGIKEARIFSAYFFLGVFAAWLINPPFEGYFYPDNGRLSVLYVVIVGITLLAVSRLNFLAGKFSMSSPLKLLVVLGIGIACFGVIWSIYGFDVLFASPFPKEIKDIWVERISELYTPMEGIIFFFSYGLIPLIALVIGSFALFAKDNPFKLPLCFFMFGLAVYTALTYTIGVRFANYASIFAVLVFVFIVDLWLRKSGINDKYVRRFSPLKRKIIAVFGWSFLFIYTIFINVFWVHGNNVSHSYLPDKFYQVVLSDREGSVLSDVFYGPHIIWKANRPVIGTPYHRNVEGITDTHKIFFAEDMEEARRLVLKHDIRDIFLPGLFNLAYFKDFWDYDKRLYSRLITNENIPCWLTKDALGEVFKVYLYRVDMKKVQKPCPK